MMHDHMTIWQRREIGVKLGILDTVGGVNTKITTTRKEQVTQDNLYMTSRL